jgi:hypothetical protein
MGVGLAVLGSAALMAAETGDVCVQSYLSTANCAGPSDVSIEEMFVISDSGSCITDDSIMATFELRVEAGGTDRYDIGLFIGLGDGELEALNGDSCYHDFLDGALTTSPSYSDIRPNGANGIDEIDGGPWPDLDAGDVDSCGDIEANTELYKVLQPITFSCTDHDLSGFADVHFCSSWSNNVNNGGQGSDLCTDITGATPSTPAKCACDYANTSKPLPGKVIIRKTTVPGGAGPFTFSQDVDDSGDFELSHGESVEFDVVDWIEPENPENPDNWEPLVFNVTEHVDKKWDLTDIECTENLVRPGTDNTTVNVGGRAATLRVDPGETVICEFINQAPAVPATPDWALWALLVMLGFGGMLHLRRRAIA